MASVTIIHSFTFIKKYYKFIEITKYSNVILPTVLLQPLVRSFVCRWGHELGDIVHLIYYEEIFFDIQLERVYDNIYLIVGWENFFNHHRLEASDFHVSIFDHWTLELANESDFSEGEILSTINPVFRITLVANRDGYRKIVSSSSTSIPSNLSLF